MKFKFKCPYCYSVHDIRTSGMKCSYNVPGKSTQCYKKVEKDTSGWIAEGDKLACLKCKSAKKMIYCSVIDKEIPKDFWESDSETDLFGGDSLSIALIGAKASGKSNYIGALINEIRRKMVGPFNASLKLTVSDESKAYYDAFYFKPLFESGMVIDATAQGEIPPLIFPLNFMNKKNKITKTAILTFYDTAGENLDSGENMLINNRYIPNADGIILLLDPLQVPSIRAKLEGKIPLPQKNTDVVEVLSRVVQNIREVHNVRGTIKKHLALAFTKIDALEAYDIIREDSCLRNESEHLGRGKFVRSDFESVNLEMQDVLENWLDEEIIQLMKNFEKYSLFGVTALGAIPDGKKLAGNGISPRRVLDPLLWLLAENKYIDVVKK